ncbi:MAG: hypothetical protein WDW38_003134 [Sanguina aurantia]
MKADKDSIASLQESAMSSINEMGNVKADIAVLVACLIPQPPPAGHHYQYQEAAAAGPRPSCVATKSEFLPCTVTDLDDDAPVTAAAAAATQEGVVSPVVQWHFFQRLEAEGGESGAADAECTVASQRSSSSEHQLMSRHRSIDHVNSGSSSSSSSSACGYSASGYWGSSSDGCFARSSSNSSSRNSSSSTRLSICTVSSESFALGGVGEREEERPAVPLAAACAHNHSSEGSQRTAACGDMGKTKSLPPTQPAADVAGLGLSCDSRHQLAATAVKSGEVMMSSSDAGSDPHPTTPVSVGFFLDGTGLSREVCDKEGGVMGGCLGSLVVKKQRGKVGGAVHKLEKVLVQGWRAVVLPWW